MNWPKRNPLTPNSLAADGIQGADARTLGPCNTEHSSLGVTRRLAALSSIAKARECLDGCALATDDPDPGMVEAADLLDAAAECLARADFADAIKNAPAGDA